MTLDSIDWRALTAQEARRLRTLAKRADDAAAARAHADDSDANIAAAIAAFTTWENLQVFVICGVRPD